MVIILLSCINEQEKHTMQSFNSSSLMLTCILILNHFIACKNALMHSSAQL